MDPNLNNESQPHQITTGSKVYFILQKHMEMEVVSIDPQEKTAYCKYLNPQFKSFEFYTFPLDTLKIL